MADEMGTFRVNMEIENPGRPGVKRSLDRVLVDTGAELSWVPSAVLESLGVERNSQWRFRQADGTLLERWTGTVVIHLGDKRAGDEVVFGEPGDLTLLGARTLESLNLRCGARDQAARGRRSRAGGSGGRWLLRILARQDRFVPGHEATAPETAAARTRLPELQTLARNRNRRGAPGGAR